MIETEAYLEAINAERALTYVRPPRSRHSLDALGRVVLRAVDHRAHRIGAQGVGPVGLEQREELGWHGTILAKPWTVSLGRQDHRHSVMELGDECIGCSRDDGAALDRHPVGRLVPALPQAGEGEGLAVLERDVLSRR